MFESMILGGALFSALLPFMFAGEEVLCSILVSSAVELWDTP